MKKIQEQIKENEQNIKEKLISILNNDNSKKIDQTFDTFYLFFKKEKNNTAKQFMASEPSELFAQFHNTINSKNKNNQEKADLIIEKTISYLQTEQGKKDLSYFRKKND